MSQLLSSKEEEINNLILAESDSCLKYNAFLPENIIFEKIKEIKKIDETFEFKETTKTAIKEWLYWTYFIEQEATHCPPNTPFDAYIHHKDIYDAANLGIFNQRAIFSCLSHNFYIKN